MNCFRLIRRRVSLVLVPLLMPGWSRGRGRVVSLEGRERGRGRFWISVGVILVWGISNNSALWRHDVGAWGLSDGVVFGGRVNDMGAVLFLERSIAYM